jgi:hypothetical protein
MADFYIATEDQLSETLASLIVHEAGHTVAAKIPKDRRKHAGFGYLKARLPDFIASCQGGINFLLLTDLDTCPCPPELLHNWFGNMTRPDSLLVRVAVREVETWVLADRMRIAEWLGVSRDIVPLSPEECLDPKAELLKLAEKAKSRDIREGLLPKKGAVSKVGIEYNTLLCEFVTTLWRIDEALPVAPSLAKALQRLREFP